ncbi:MAG: hypothetical protein VKP62_06220 [Candidatus Sericytochromatia bacterium]|nr:hypothetical protein [Candidatus Sericytochromatia bacterium]
MFAGEDALVLPPDVLPAPHLWRLKPGRTRLGMPRPGNGLYLVLATPARETVGSTQALQVEGAALNPPGESPVPLLDADQAASDSACGSLGAAVTDQPSAAWKIQATSEPSEPSERESFWVIRPGLPAPPGSAYDEVETPCRRVFTGERCYVYLDERVTAPLARREAEALGAVFDAQLAPGVTGLLGPLPQPGIDGDPRVYLVLSPEVSAGGRSTALAYFARRDQRLRSDANPSARHSNQRDVLFIDARNLLPESRNDLYTAVSHELGHLVHFTRQAPKLPPGQEEKLWLEESLAMLASHACGLGYAASPTMFRHVQAYLSQAYKYSLTDWPGNPGRVGYGMGYLFLLYLQERFGQDVITELADRAEVGKDALERVLTARGSSYRQVFGDFSVALVNDDLFEPWESPWQFPRSRLRDVTPWGQLNGPAAMRMGPDGALVPRRADVAYMFHVKPDPLATALLVRWQGDGILAALVP